MSTRGDNPTGARAAQQIASMRRARGLTLHDLQARLADLGHPLLPSALSKIENGQRRIDVDDLVGLALALDTSPLALLLPPADTDSEEHVQLVGTSDRGRRQLGELRSWLQVDFGRMQTAAMPGLPVQVDKSPYPLPATSQPGRERGSLVLGSIPRPAPHFVNRGQVRMLHEALQQHSTAVVVTGMRGAGKTQLAAAYAREVMAEETAKVVGWIRAETRDSTLAGLTEIAGKLGVADPAGDSLVSARRLRDHLNSARELSGVLVFDNATDPDFLREFLPTGGGVRVVITSTDRAFTSLGEGVVDAATGYDRTESIHYLHTATGLDDPVGADTLATEVGDLPLALACAAATITARRLDYRGYQELLAAQPLPAALPRPRGAGYDRAVDQALGLAIDTVTADTGDEAVDERVRWLVGVMAMLSPSGVEAALLEQDPDHLTNAAIARCVEGSLVSWSTSGRMLVMHLLTGRVIRERASANDTLDTLAANAVAVLAPRLFEENEAFRRRAEGARLVDHIETLAEITRQYSAIHSDTRAAVLATQRWATLQLTSAADLRHAISHAENTLIAHRDYLGEDHPATLATRLDLAHAYREAGRVGEAIEMLERVLIDQVRVLGDEHPGTLATRHNLAGACGEAGRVGEAIEMLERVLTDQVRLFGDEHPGTLATRRNLAGAYRAAGRVGEAIEMLERVLTDQVRLFGDEHPGTLATRRNLAGAYQAAGRVGEAIVLFEHVLTSEGRLFGDEYPGTLATRHNLAGAYREAGRVGEAIEMLERVLTDQVRVLGDDHPYTLATRHNLAGAYQAAGRMGEAIEQL